MRRIYLLAFTVASFVCNNQIFSQVTVIPATGGTSLCPGSGIYSALTNITIVEGVADDISTNNRSIVLNAPSGFNFKPATGTFSVTPASDLASSTFTVTATSITIRMDIFNATGDGNINAIIISGIEVKADAGATTGNILRVGGGPGGNLAINGDDVGDNVIHGTLAVRDYGVSLTPSHLLCRNDGSGALQATITGTAGSSPYAYYWSTGATTSAGTTTSITSLSVAPTYSLSVTDNNGCIATASAVLTQPATFTISAITTTSVTCNGGTDGTASSSVSGGTMPVSSYLWYPGLGTNSSANGLSAGTQTLVAADANGCVSTRTVSVAQATPVGITLTTLATISCNGGNNGKVRAAPSGGTPPYTYQWTPSFAGTASTGANMTAGNYTVTVTDANSCVSTATVTLAQPASVVIGGFTTTTVNCYGAATGSATGSAAGGTPGYTYKWTNGSTNITANNLLANTLYTFTVTDANLCSLTANVSIAQPSAPLSIAAFNVTEVNCFGANTGSAATSVSGGTAPYVYSWSPGGGADNTGTALIAGNYTMTATDANSCVSTRTVSISQPSQLTAALSILQHVSSYGGSNGVVSSLPGGGTPSYIYGWSNGETTQNISGLIAGTYSLNLTDANSCNTSPVTVAVTVTQPLPSPLLGGTFISSASSVCMGSTAPVNLTSTAFASGGVPPYNYQWEESTGGAWGNSGSGQTSADYTVPPPLSQTTSYRRKVCDSYTVSTTCAYTNTITVTVLALPTAWFTMASPPPYVDSTNHVATAPINMTGFGNPAGGSGYFSSDGSGVVGTQFRPAEAGIGSYSITYTYTGPNGCQSASTLYPVDVNSGSITFTSITGAVCSGDGIARSISITHNTVNSPSVTVSSSSTAVSGYVAVIGFLTSAPGTDMIEYTPGGFVPGGSGSYTDTIIYMHMVSGVVQRVKGNIITVNTTPTITATSPANLSVCYSALTQISLTSSGLSSGSYLWSTGETAAFISPNVTAVAPSVTSVYNVTGTEGSSCYGVATTTITVIPLPTIAFSGSTSFCRNVNSTYTISTVTDPGFGAFSSPSPGFNVTGVAGSVILNPYLQNNVSNPIVYQFTLTATGCVNTNTVIATINVPPSTTLTLPSGICADAVPVQLGGSTNLTAVGDIYSFTTPGNGFVSPAFSITTLFDPSAAMPGNHDITFRQTSGSTGCSDSTTETLTVNALPFVRISFQQDSVFCKDNNSKQFFNVTPSSGGSFYFYTVGGAPGLSVNTFTPSVANIGTTHIVYTYTNAATGCVEDDTTYAVVNPLPAIAFTGLSSPPYNYCNNVNNTYTLTALTEPGTGVFTTSPATFSVQDISGGVATLNAYGQTSGNNRNIIYQFTHAVTGCTNRDTQLVNIKDPPNTAISSLPNICVDASPVQLIATTNVTETDLNYTFRTTGNAFASPVHNDTVLFNPASASVGTHSVTFTQYANDGCADSTTITVRVDPLPTVSFSLTDSLFCQSEAQADLLSAVFPFPASSYDGFSSDTGLVFSGNNNRTFQISASALGTHTVTYVYRDINLCVNSDIQVVIVNPVPSVAITATNLCDGKPTRFMDRSTVAGGSIAKWKWVFGDNLAEGADTSSLQHPSYLYPVPKTVNVSLNVTTNAGCANINPVPFPFEILTAPSLAFSWTNECYGAETSYDPVDETLNLLWNFGDGDTSSQVKPSHTYAGVGIFDVKLTGTHKVSGCIDSLTQQINIRPVIDLGNSYVADFDNVNAGWTARNLTSDTTQNWLLGANSLKGINNTNPTKMWYTKSFAQTFSVSGQAYTTDSYLPDQQSWVEGPCFDFTNAQRPMLTVDKRADVDSKDGAVIQYSFDHGKTWTNLGSKDDEAIHNWYNSIGLDGNPGNQQTFQAGWSGRDTAWVNARHDLDMMLGHSAVRLRIAFGSNDIKASDTIDYFGFAFDNFTIKERSHKILLEHFTNASVAWSNFSSDTINRVAEGKTFVNDLVDIQYHVGFPNSDQFNALNPGDPNTRVLYYGVSPSSPSTDIPISFLDGMQPGMLVAIGSSLNAPLSYRRLLDAPVILEIDTGKLANDSIVTTITTGSTVEQNQRVTLHAALLDRENGGHKSILTKLLPNAAGTYIDSLKKNQVYRIATSLGNIPWSSAGSEVVVFIQNNATKEVYAVQSTQKYVAVSSGLTELFKEDHTVNFALFPNPASDQAVILFRDLLAADCTLEIFNQVGAVVESFVLQSGNNSFTVNTSSLPPGIYFLKVGGNEKAPTGHQKLIVVH